MIRNHLAHLLGLALLAMLAISFSTVASADQSLLNKIQERGTLRVGLEGTYPPFNYVNSDGELVGFEVDIARAVAQELGVKAEFVPTKWDGMLAGLDTKRFDVIINQVTITPERKKKYDFTQPYTVSGMQIITRRELADQFQGAQDLAGVAVGVGLGTNYQQWLNEHVPQADVRTYQDDPSKLQDLMVGRIDAAINDRLMVGFLMQKTDGKLVAAGKPFATMKAGIALRKGNPKLLHALNNALDALRKDGTLAQISKQWFGINVTK